MSFRELQPSCMLAPVPAVLLGCRGTGADAAPNLITVAWAGTVCSDPPMVSVSVRPSRHSHALILESGEFTVNVPAASMAKAVDYCGVRSGRDTDKWADCSLHPVPAPGMRYAPAVAECPISMACAVDRVISLCSHDLIIGQIRGVLADESLFDEKDALHPERARLLSYTHGVYQRAEGALGFFGFSVARPDVLQRRMRELAGD